MTRYNLHQHLITFAITVLRDFLWGTCDHTDLWYKEKSEDDEHLISGATVLFYLRTAGANTCNTKQQVSQEHCSGSFTLHLRQKLKMWI